MITGEQVLHAIEVFMYHAVVAERGEKTALACVRALSDCIWLNFRGGSMYIPSGYKKNCQQRDDAIWREFNGTNHADLGIKHALSTMQIYSIIKRQRKASVRKVQHDMFPLPPEQASKKPVTVFVIEDFLPAELVLCGLAEAVAKDLANRVSIFLCKTFPGVLVCITDEMHKKYNNDGQQGLFD